MEVRQQDGSEGTPQIRHWFAGGVGWAHWGDAGAHRTPTALGGVSFELVIAKTAPP